MPDEQYPSNEPEAAPETAIQAFARLDGRIALMSRAVEHLAAERANIDIPDYSATLGQMNTRLAAIAQGLGGIAEKPAMLLTPEGLATRMDAAAEKSRRTDSATLREAREAHQEAARIIRELVGAVRDQREQRRRLVRTATCSMLAGCLLWSFLPGVVARTLPGGLAYARASGAAYGRRADFMGGRNPDHARGQPGGLAGHCGCRRDAAR